MVGFFSFLVIALTVVVALAIAAASSAPHLTQQAEDLPKIAAQHRPSAVTIPNFSKPTTRAQGETGLDKLPILVTPTETLLSPPLVFAAGLQ